MSRRGKPQTVSPSERRGIQSVEISAVILLVIAEAGTAVPLKTLSERSSMPSSKIHRYLSSFIKIGLVSQDPKSGWYDLGPTALKLGLSALTRFDVIESAHNVMRELSSEFEVTSLLSVWGPQGPTIVRWERTQLSFVASLNLGSVMPLLSSATGRVFLAYMPAAVTTKFLDKELKKNRVSNAPSVLLTSKKKVRELVAEIRSVGYATVEDIFVPGLCGLAAPVLDNQGESSAVITLIGPGYLKLAEDDYIIKSMLQKCQGLSLFAP